MTVKEKEKEKEKEREMEKEEEEEGELPAMGMLPSFLRVKAMSSSSAPFTASTCHQITFHLFESELIPYF